MFYILILALILRLINLNQSLWLDEALQFKSIYYFSFKDLLTVYMPKDFNPPLSYIINFSFSKIFGYSEIALRLPSVIFAILTVWLVYKISKLLFHATRSASWRTQLVTISASLLLTTSGLHIYYSQEARMYSLVTLAVTGSIWALIKYLKTKTNLIYYFIFTLTLLYSHYLAWFILPAQLILVFILKKNKLKKILLTQLFALIGFLPWLPIFLQQLKTGLSAANANQQWFNVVGGISFKNLSLIPVKFLLGRLPVDNNLFFIALLSLPFLLLTYLIFLALKNINKNRFATITIFSWLILPLIMIIFVSLKVPVLSYFRILYLLPAFYLILSLAISYLPKSLQKPVIVFLLSINLISSSLYLFNSNFHREDWQQLTQVLAAKNINNSPAVIIPVVDAPLKYYYHASDIVSSDNIQSILDKSEFWLIPYAQPIFDPDQKTNQKITQAGFKENYKQHFRGNLTLIQYIK